MIGNDRSKYLTAALDALSQSQHPTSLGGVASGLGSQALMQFAQGRAQRAPMNGGISLQDPGMTLGPDGNPMMNAATMPQTGGLYGLGQRLKGFFGGAR